MTIDEIISAAVESAVTRAMEPLRREVAALSRTRTPSEYLTVAEAATRFGVSTKTVRRRIAAGEIKSTRIGAAVRVVAGDIGSA